EINDTASAPEKVPVLNIPIAGELVTVSSMLSALKNLANHVSFLLFPKAKLNDWANGIVNFYHAGGHRRFRVDHLGFPMGRIVRWNEDWAQGFSITGATISGAPAVAHDLTGAPFAYDVTVVTNLILAAAK